MEDAEIEKLRKRFGEVQEKAGPSFADLDLEIGEITEVKKHPDAEKLYIEKVKMADGERQIVSSLVPYFTANELIGKKIIVVKNLMPAKLRGVESQGMLLVAEDAEGNLELLSSGEWKLGEKVTLETESRPKPHIDIKEFAKIKLEVKDGKVLADGDQLYINGKELKTEKIKEGKVS